MEYSAAQLYRDLRQWSLSGDAVTIATVIGVRGPNLVGIGANLALTSKGRTRGSVGFPGVDREIYDRASEVLETGQPALLNLNVREANIKGSTVIRGTTIEIFMRRHSDDLTARAIENLMLRKEPLVIAQPVRPLDYAGARILIHETGELGSIDHLVDTAVVNDGRGILRKQESGEWRWYHGMRHEIAVFFQPLGT